MDGVAQLVDDLRRPTNGGFHQKDCRISGTARDCLLQAGFGRRLCAFWELHLVTSTLSSFRSLRWTRQHCAELVTMPKIERQWKWQPAHTSEVPFKGACPPVCELFQHASLCVCICMQTSTQFGTCICFRAENSTLQPASPLTRPYSQGFSIPVPGKEASSDSS